MAAASHGDQQIVRAPEVDGPDNVRGAGAARDQGRFSIEESVPDTARLVVARLTAEQQRAPQARGEIRHVPLEQRDLRAGLVDRVQVGGKRAVERNECRSGDGKGGRAESSSLHESPQPALSGSP